MKLKDILGITGYYYYGFGGHFTSGAPNMTIQDTSLYKNSGATKVCTIEACKSFKLNRAFVDNFAVTTTSLDTFQTEPTHQGFYYDSFLKLLKANNITTIWSATGEFNWIAESGYSQRKSPCYDHSKSPLDSTAWQDLATLCSLITQKYKDNQLLDYIQPLNEFDFRWNVSHVLTPEEYAVCFYECYKAIRNVSLTQKIIIGSTINPTIDTLTRFLNKLDTITPTPIRDFYLDFHWYMRDGSSNQGGGTTGITPEDAKAYEFGKQLDQLCEQKGLLGWFCTETGWATDNSKQHAPDLEGFTRAEAQGILFTRLALIWGACKYCKGVTFWHSRDLYDSEPYAYAGVNNKDWSAKAGRLIVDDFLNKYGELEVDFFIQTATNRYVAGLNNDTSLGWTNKLNEGAITPKPEIVDQPTTKPQLLLNITGDSTKVDIVLT